MKVVVAKQYRLLSRDPKTRLYNKDGSKEVKRDRAVVEESVVKTSEGNYGETGLLYVIDKEATAEREKDIADKKAGKNPAKSTPPATDPDFPDADLTITELEAKHPEVKYDKKVYKVKAEYVAAIKTSLEDIM